jgi:antitoxin MazE
MIVKVKKIGNSKGIIIPKNLIEMCDIGEEVSLVVEDNHIIISAPKNPRAEWEVQFKAALKEVKEPNNEYLNHIPNEFDEDEWTW